MLNQFSRTELLIVRITRKNIAANMKKLQTNCLIKRIGADKSRYWQIEE